MKKNQKNKFYITTPIFYINDIPHIGHAYATIAADTLARYYRGKLGEENVLFVTGTDENSQKTINAAESKGMDVQEYTDETAKKWQDTFSKLGITYSRFIRTTDDDHNNTVRDILTKVYENGDIYKGIYEGLYCVGHEAFMKSEDLIDGLCPDHNKAPETIKEENWFFRLSKYQDKLLKYIEDNPKFIRPESRRNEVLSFIKNKGLEDFSISRESQSWGIELPFDKTQVAYVWFDALLNYVTAAGYGTDEFKKWWPADLHLVGKDITKFHCIYWPAMLWSAGLELPEQIFAHGFFNIEGNKMSKSLGNSVSPLDLVEKYGNDALRYYLLREISFGNDGDFSMNRFKVLYESELANTLGNLVSRTAAMLKKYNNSEYIVNLDVKSLVGLEDFIVNLEFEKYLSEIFSRLTALNVAIEDNKPWELIKNDKKKAVEFLSSVALEIISIADDLKYFLPDTCESILKIFNDGRVDDTVGILFPRLDM
ncbi:MAG: methionine--tRNA ligase [Candidatus Saccharibacteria bacterium]